MKKISILSIAFIYLSLTSVFAQKPITKATPTILQSHICNSQATYFPKPDYPKIDTNISGGVNVVIRIDEQGNVKSANAVSGHPLLRKEAEETALKAKFKTTVFEGKAVAINCLLFYQFVPPPATVQNEESKQTAQSEQAKQTDVPKPKVIVDLGGGTVTGKEIKLPKPKIPFCNCRFGSVKSVTSVLVQAEIDEQGNVVKATAISGHPLLKIASEKAAQKSKFTPSLDSGERVKAKATIIYKFLIVNKWSVKFAGVEVKNIQIENQAAN